MPVYLTNGIFVKEGVVDFLNVATFTLCASYRQASENNGSTTSLCRLLVTCSLEFIVSPFLSLPFTPQTSLNCSFLHKTPPEKVVTNHFGVFKVKDWSY